jgi:hypothetical protein
MSIPVRRIMRAAVSRLADAGPSSPTKCTFLSLPTPFFRVLRFIHLYFYS